MLIAYVLLFIVLSPGILFTARFGKKMGKVTVAALHALVFLIAVHLLDVTESFQTTVPTAKSLYPSRAMAFMKTSINPNLKAYAMAKCNGFNYFSNATHNVNRSPSRGRVTKNTAYTKLLSLATQAEKDAYMKEVYSKAITCSGTSDENQLCFPNQCVPGGVRKSCTPDRTPVGTAPRYDNNKIYNTNDRVTYTDGKVYYLTQGVGAPGYYPGSGNQTAVWLVGRPDICTEVPAEIPISRYDPKKKYKKGDMVMCNIDSFERLCEKIKDLTPTDLAAIGGTAGPNSTNGRSLNTWAWTVVEP